MTFRELSGAATAQHVHTQAEHLPTFPPNV